MQHRSKSLSLSRLVKLINEKGNLKWANNVRWKGQPEFNAKDLQPWYSDSKPAGKFKEVHIEVAASKKTRFTFLTVADAGHMVRDTILLNYIETNKLKGPSRQARAGS